MFALLRSMAKSQLTSLKSGLRPRSLLSFIASARQLWLEIQVAMFKFG